MSLIQLFFLLGKNAAETVSMLTTAYKDNALGKTQGYKWFSHFKSGEMMIVDKPCPGRPSTSRTDKNVTNIKITGLYVILDRFRHTVNKWELLYVGDEVLVRNYQF